MFFTGMNALAYAEISTADTSKATPIAAVFQQLSIALGVALAGGILEVSTTIHGGPLTLSDFHIAFFIVAAVSAAASLSFMRLAPDAGGAVSSSPPGPSQAQGVRSSKSQAIGFSSANADRFSPLKIFRQQIKLYRLIP